MLIAIFGESCTGKSTLAKTLKASLGAEIYTGKDFLRLAKNEAIAAKLFQKKLDNAATGENIIYVITEKEHLALLPARCIRILVTADLDTIKERFTARMRGNLPTPVAAMLEKKHGSFDKEPHDFHMISGLTDLDVFIREVLAKAAQ